MFLVAVVHERPCDDGDEAVLAVGLGVAARLAGALAAVGSAARILAGGTDLLVQMRSGAVKPYAAAAAAPAAVSVTTASQGARCGRIA